MSSSKSSKNAVSLMRYFIPLKKYPLLLLLALQISITNGQGYLAIDTVQYNCYYNYTFQQDSTNKYSIKTQEMCLQVGNKRSKFVSYNKLIADSISESYKALPFQQRIQSTLDATAENRTHSYCNYYIYKNYPGKDTITFTSDINHTYPQVIEINRLEWKIKPDRDTTILGYPCKQATTRYAGRNYIAWFTMNIPVSDGPYKFFGLPGLILQITDTKGQHKFTLTEIKKASGNKPILFVKNDKAPVNMSPEQYAKALNIRMGELFNKVSREDGITFESEEAKAQAMQKLKTRNNFIEIYE